MKIKLYHGSNVAIEQIDLSKSKRGKDFGKGFYLNPDINQATAMAHRTFSLLNEGAPTVTSFEFDLNKAYQQGLNIKVFEDYSQEWADFIVENRKNIDEFPVHDYDIVIGPIADDTVGVQIRQYVMGYISIERLVEELRFKGHNASQYFFGTESAIKLLEKL